jgi:hypothetical protein
MTASPRRAFHYHANAHVLSARFTRPIQHLIEVQAATTLPSIGGHGNSHVDQFSFQEFVSFRRGYSHVSGSKHESDGTYTTLVTSVVEGLNILDIITADRVVGRLASSYQDGQQEPNVTLVGSKFENLRIAGCEVKAPLNDKLFDRMRTFADVRKEFQSSSDFRKIAEDPFRTGERIEKPGISGVVLCSYAEKVETNCPGVTAVGHHGLAVPEFGTVYLAEVIYQHAHVKLTMIRFELGSPISGSGTAVQLDTDGRPYPPPPTSDN